MFRNKTNKEIKDVLLRKLNISWDEVLGVFEKVNIKEIFSSNRKEYHIFQSFVQEKEIYLSNDKLYSLMNVLYFVVGYLKAEYLLEIEDFLMLWELKIVGDLK